MKLKRDESNYPIDISHFFHYISSYEYNPETRKELIDNINTALEVARKTTTVQIVNQDGDHCFHITPTGYIILMIPWQKYKVAEY